MLELDLWCACQRPSMGAASSANRYAIAKEIAAATEKQIEDTLVGLTPSEFQRVAAALQSPQTQGSGTNTEEVDVTLQSHETRGSGTNTEEVDAIFDACDVSLSGDLSLSESKYALQAFGLYPKDQDIKKTVQELGQQFPLDKPSFCKVAQAGGGMRGIFF